MVNRKKNTRSHSERNSTNTRTNTLCRKLGDTQTHSLEKKTTNALFQFDMKEDVSNDHHYQPTH